MAHYCKLPTISHIKVDWSFHFKARKVGQYREQITFQLLVTAYAF